MKKLKEFMNGFKFLIKKNFFIRILIDTCHVHNTQKYVHGLNEKEQGELIAEEYVASYITTTRWQTL
jgi:endonuclease IV